MLATLDAPTIVPVVSPLGSVWDFVAFIDTFTDATPLALARSAEHCPIGRYLYREQHCLHPYVTPQWWVPDYWTLNSENFEELAEPTPFWVRFLIQAFDSYPPNHILTAGEIRQLIRDTRILELDDPLALSIPHY